MLCFHFFYINGIDHEAAAVSNGTLNGNGMWRSAGSYEFFMNDRKRLMSNLEDEAMHSSG